MPTSKQRSIRVAMPEALYEKLKRIAPEHGDISTLIRDLLLKHLAACEDPDEQPGIRAGITPDS